MIEFNKVPVTGDPASSQQFFEKFKINVLCCRYWWLDEWQSEKMTFPYWRLYWNKNKGAFVTYKQIIELKPDTVVLIPPFTPFSTVISGKNMVSKQVYNLKGGWIHSKEEEADYLDQGSILHFFIHFNLGFPYDNYPAGLYAFSANSEVLNCIHFVIELLLRGKQSFSICDSLNLYNLIISLVNKLPADLWQKNNIDPRIKEIIEFIENNPGIAEDNGFLASRIKMATNSFARLFKENIGLTPHIYINQVRIDRACDLLHHSNFSIDRIAEQCGFFDRYHFSKMFKKTLKISPAEYRKGLVIGG
jgi:AraC-like DNA-binding protein